jgi:SAM-dependent methyltransferase
MNTGRATYGVDAPGVPLGMGAGGLVLVGVGLAAAASGAGAGAVAGPLLGAALLLASTALYLHTTMRGKLQVWDELLDGLGLRGGEQVLDLGCGRGAVLLAAARRLPRGRAVGVDLWRTVDQSGNSSDTTRRNAVTEGLADRVELHTGDLTALPFPDATFDLVLSGLAIHNIPDADARRTAVDEAVRVLRPGGRLLIVDIVHVADYAERLRELGLDGVQRRGLGPRYWYGGPWVAASLVTAVRP